MTDYIQLSMVHLYKNEIRSTKLCLDLLEDYKKEDKEYFKEKFLFNLSVMEQRLAELEKE